MPHTEGDDSIVIIFLHTKYGALANARATTLVVITGEDTHICSQHLFPSCIWTMSFKQFVMTIVDLVHTHNVCVLKCDDYF